MNTETGSGTVKKEEPPLPMVVVDRGVRPASRRRWLVLPVAVAVGLLGFGVRAKATGVGAPAPAASAAARGERAVVGLGRVLPWSDVVAVAPPFGAGDARIAKLAVGEGDRVEQGAVLAVLDNERLLLAAVAAARAQVGSREAARGQVASSVKAGRAEAQATLERTEIAAERASKELTRAEALRKDGVGTEQSFDLQRSASDEATREVARARATLSRYGAGSVGGQADVVAAARQVDAARADLARAEAELDKAYVRAPIAGTVLTVHGRVGERPGALGLLSMGDIDRMKVEVEVYQTQIGRVSPGDVAECEAEALPERLRGVVHRVGLEVGKQRLVDMTPAASTDARVVRVVVALDEPSTRLARRFSNLQVTARIRPAGAP